MVLAFVLLGAAFIAAYFAWHLSQPQVPEIEVTDSETDDRAGPREQSQTFPVVFASQAIPRGSTIRAEDLVVHQLPVQPPEIYENTDTLVGTVVWRGIGEGEMIRPGHLRRGSRLAGTLLPSERAVAIAVDEVVGTGGFLSPGDRVDVLLYLRDTRQDAPPSAQVILEDVRLLAFVDRVQPSPEQAAAEKEESEQAEFRGKTAVMAVPQEDMSRLMLASSAGTLRLALRSSLQGDTAMAVADADSAATAELMATDNVTQAKEEREAPIQFIQLDALLPEQPPARQPQKKPAPEPEPTPVSEPEKIRIPIHRGGMADTAELPRTQ